ncbi:MAG: PIN domain-containing protein [Sphingomonadaceae bacterium]|nr:PIN domain-containing protein [Sphingomonadaceae bacterium]
MTFLLDTCVAIDLRDDRNDMVTKITALPVRPKISAITRVELEGGVYVDPEFAVSRRRALDVLLRRLPVVDFSTSMATVYGRIVSQAGFSRRKIIDRMIAATAMVNDLTLITTNGSDFADIEGLKLEIWHS